jgi:hypothetical protein
LKDTDSRGQWDPFLDKFTSSTISNPLLELFSVKTKKFGVFNSRETLVKQMTYKPSPTQFQTFTTSTGD